VAEIFIFPVVGSSFSDSLHFFVRMHVMLVAGCALTPSDERTESPNSPWECIRNTDYPPSKTRPSFWIISSTTLTMGITRNNNQARENKQCSLLEIIPVCFKIFAVEGGGSSFLEK
jgi:hypothetical protein